MPVAVMDVGEMGVSVRHRRVFMWVCVRLAPVDPRSMLVPMVLVVDVSMRMRERFVVMLVLVALAEVEPHARRHQDTRSDEAQGDWLPQHDERNGGADERGN